MFGFAWKNKRAIRAFDTAKRLATKESDKASEALEFIKTDIQTRATPGFDESSKKEILEYLDAIGRLGRRRNRMEVTGAGEIKDMLPFVKGAYSEQMGKILTKILNASRLLAGVHTPAVSKLMEPDLLKMLNDIILLVPDYNRHTDNLLNILKKKKT
jgi:hypothetical protein